MEYIITKYRRGFVVTSQTFIVEASTLEEACNLVNDDEYCGKQLIDLTNEEIEWEECKEEWLEDNKGEIFLTKKRNKGELNNMEKISYTFTDGLKVEGTVEQILACAKSLGKTVDLDKLPRPRGFYKSSTKGLTAIKDMATPHVRNALCKRASIYFSELTKKRDLDIKTFLKEFTSLVDDQEIQDLYSELGKR